MTHLTITYAEPDRALAERVAADLESHNYTLGELTPGGALLAVTSAAALDDDAWNLTVHDALTSEIPVVLLATDRPDLPPELADLPLVNLATGYRSAAVRDAVRRALAPARAGASLDDRNRRWGLALGGALIVLFGLYTVAIVVFDIEAPQEEFERAYTRSAATVNAFAQPFIPLSTEQAEAFEITLESNDISDELATIVVGTATQAAANGGFTPIPTGQIIAPAELSIVRQTATGGAVIRATQTAAADTDTIAATATQAALDADAQLQESLLTVTAGAGE